MFLISVLNSMYQGLKANEQMSFFTKLSILISSTEYSKSVWNILNLGPRATRINSFTANLNI